jgi:hypothetical protein
MKVVCNCGYSDNMDKFITTGEPYKKKEINKQGEEYIQIVYDWEYKCPKCGVYEKKTVVSSLSVDEEGLTTEED